MKLYPNIEFSNNLIENEETIITYSGYLFQNNSDSVTIVYGFGNSWNNTTELEMQKNNNGFSAKIKALEFSNFNFCFRNSNYEWDNNNNQNYTAPISKPKVQEAFIINENLIENIIDDILENNISKIEDEKTEEISANIIENGIEDFEINIENNEPINIEDSVVNITEESSLTENINQVFGDLYNGEVSNKSENNALSATENTEINLEALIDEILSPVEESTTFDKNTYTISEEPDNSETSTHEFEEDEKVNNLIDNLITNLYENVNSSLENLSQTKIEDNFSEKIISDLNNTTNENTYTTINNIIENNIDKKANLETSEISETSSITENEIQSIQDAIFDNFDEFVEESLLDSLNTDNETVDDSKALIEVNNIDDLIVSARSLSKFYLIKKKVKLAFYKLLALPRTLISNLGESKN